MNKKINVGFIGLNPDSHWAQMAHLPALKFLSDDYEIIGVANSTYESAKRTKDALGLKYAFESPDALVMSDEVDLVVVTVKVPYHYELVKKALQQGKHVHCEWPLANGLEEALELERLALEKGVVATTGTQMRTAVEVQYIKALIQEGYVGEVLSTTVIGNGGNWGAETVKDLAYLSDKSTGATMLTIPFGHTLAGIREVLGELKSVDGRLILRRNKLYITDTKETITPTAEDQIMVSGQFESGAAFSAHYRGGITKGNNFLWEINGTKGDIQITGPLGHGQMVQLDIKGSNDPNKPLEVLTPDASYYEDLPKDVISRNVCGIYKLIASDIRNHTRLAPSFSDGVKLHILLDQIEKTSETK